jgi:hypothetical protein
MKTVLLALFVRTISWSAVVADEPGVGQSETTVGWVKHPRNPVLGGDLGTCFDVTVLKEGGKYRMWFSWRPKKSIALVESSDGVQWSKPLIVIGPNDKSDWENDLNRPVVLKNGRRSADISTRPGLNQRELRNDVQGSSGSALRTRPDGGNIYSFEARNRPASAPAVMTATRRFGRLPVVDERLRRLCLLSSHRAPVWSGIAANGSR